MDRFPTFSSRLVRVILTISGTLAWLCAAVTIRQGLTIASHSPLLWGVSACGVLAGVVAFGVACGARDSAIHATAARLVDFLHRTGQVTPGPNDRRVGGGLVWWGCLLFAANTLWVYQHQDTPFDDDQGAFLITALEIHDQGGLSELWSDLWSGRFEESNRHPLLIAMQSLQPTVEFGRGLSCLLATLMLGLATAILWRRMGPLSAGVFAVLIGTNGAWLYHVPRLVCESLLTGIAGLAWLALLTPALAPSTSSPQFSTLTPQRSAWLGVLLGLAYLTKGTGLLLFVGAVLAYGVIAIWSGSTRRTTIVSACVLILAFLVAASPLLVRNQMRFGSPTYNVNSYLLWVDTYESPNAMADRMTLPEARSAYLATHSATELIQREATGLAWEAFIGLRTLGPAPWDDARLLFGLPLFALGLLGLCHMPGLPVLVLIFWTGIMWVTMAWYVPITAGDRFLMPLLIPWLALAANGLVQILSLSNDPRSASRRIMLGTILWGVVITVLVWTRAGLWAC